jgi:hypothetical protein
MKLTIHKLQTRGHSPRGVRSATMVDEVARLQLPLELQAQLGPSLDRLPPVVRLKQLKVSLTIPARELSRGTLASAWARAFAVALHRSLANSVSRGTDRIRSFSSQVAYRAAMIHHMATRGMAPCWEFPELETLRGSIPSEAALQVLLDEPEHIEHVIEELHREGWLDIVLGLWNEISLERLIQAVAAISPGAESLPLATLVELGRAASAFDGLQARWSLADRRQAIRLWVRLQRPIPLRSVHNALWLMLMLLENPSLLTGRDSPPQQRIPLPPWCWALVREAAILYAASPPSLAESINLFAVLDALRPLVPSSAKVSAHAAASRWITSDCAGVLLLLSTVRRLDLWRFALVPEFVALGGPRALSFLLAGMGTALLKRGGNYDPGTYAFLLDPAVGLFAGIFEEPDRAGMRQFFAEANPRSLAGFVEAQTWSEAIELAATELTTAFAGQLRGFRAASREAIVRQFLRIPGRVLCEQDRLLVVLDQTPLAVALHISSMDATLHHVEWLGHRRVEFSLEGL